MEWFHLEIALKLEESVKRVENGEDVRLMIFMPPRHGKSDEATQKFPSWVLGEHPEWPFIISSYSQDLATDFGQGTRDLMSTVNYQAIFDTRLRTDTKAKAHWMTDEGGGYTAVGVGGTITGKGFKIGIIDDPFKNREEADSPVTRESVYRWWRSTFYTRQEGNTAIILILTRWHDDDLAGRLLKDQKEAIERGETEYDKWEVLEFKAIAEKDEKHRKTGEALWPHKFNTAKLKATKSALGSYEWSALYQQNPIDEENQELKREWLQYRTWEDVIKTPTRKFATIDTALSKNSKSDFTGVTRNYVNFKNEWHFKSTRYVITSKGLIDLIFTLHSEGFEKIGIEEGAYLSAVQPFLKDKEEEIGIYPNIVVLKHGGTMKETRIRGLTPRYEGKKIFHIENTCVDLEEEYLRFPKSAHDDCLDSAAYQNDIASPPSANIGDLITEAEIVQNISSGVNDQSGPVIIGISTALPIHYVIGNKQGIFFNSDGKNTKDPYDEIEKLVKRFDKCFIFSDQVGDILNLKKLQEKHKGKIFVCWFNGDPKSQLVTKWGHKEKFGEVEIGKNSLVQIIVDEMKDKRFTLNGSREDWQDFLNEWTSLFRIWDNDSMGNKVFSWESSAPQPFIKSTIYFRVGLSKFSESKATIVGDDMFGDIPQGRIFDNSFN